MTPSIVSPDTETEILTDEGCHILESWNTPDDPSVSIARARVIPGVRTRLHCLDQIKERYLIISGTGEVDVGDISAKAVGPGDVVVIPAGTPQRIRNIGKDDLVFYAICTPRFTPDCYRDLEQS